ncbi:MAG TPA: hypothetical protein GX686_05670, partial [Paracoccus sp.]|nr:hypothetical protein [Paracoccus sp. (in: a-proteobacteria)]
DMLLARHTEFDRLDQPTRASYRSTLERIARRSSLTEIEAAHRAIEQGRADAAAAEDRGQAPGAGGGHLEGARVEVGHLLVGDHRRSFREACGYRPTLLERLSIPLRKAGLWLIAMPLVGITAVLVALLGYALPAQLPGWQLVTLLALVMLPA